MGKTKRIVNRNGMKAELARLKLIIKTHQPLMEAMRTTQKAFDAGKEAGERIGFEEGLKKALDMTKEAAPVPIPEPVAEETA